MYVHLHMPFLPSAHSAMLLLQHAERYSFHFPHVHILRMFRLLFEARPHMLFSPVPLPLSDEKCVYQGARGHGIPRGAVPPAQSALPHARAGDLVFPVLLHPASVDRSAIFPSVSSARHTAPHVPDALVRCFSIPSRAAQRAVTVLPMYQQQDTRAAAPVHGYGSAMRSHEPLWHLPVCGRIPAQISLQDRRILCTAPRPARMGYPLCGWRGLGVRVSRRRDRAHHPQASRRDVRHCRGHRVPASAATSFLRQSMSRRQSAISAVPILPSCPVLLFAHSILQYVQRYSDSVSEALARAEKPRVSPKFFQAQRCAPHSRLAPYADSRLCARCFLPSLRRVHWRSEAPLRPFDSLGAVPHALRIPQAAASDVPSSRVPAPVPLPPSVLPALFETLLLQR